MKEKLKYRLLKTLEGAFTLIIVLLFFLIFVIGLVDTSKENCVKVSGMVEKIWEGGTKDIIFKLKDDVQIYYINRGLENGFKLDAIRKALVGQKIELWYAKSKMDYSLHIAHLKKEEVVIYDEWN